MTEDLATLHTQLGEARAAKHKLATGKMRVTISHAIGGQNSVSFAPADMAALVAYIRELEFKIERMEGRRSGGVLYVA